MNGSPIMSDFTVSQLRYIDWLAASKYERSPTTEQLLAKELGIADRTLRRWKQLPGFKRAVTQRAREFLGEDLPEIFGALRREAIKGSFHHIKLALELTGEHTDKLKITSWQDELITLLKDGTLTPQDIMNEFADQPEIATGLFESIGIRAIEVREAKTQSAEVE